MAKIHEQIKIALNGGRGPRIIHTILNENGSRYRTEFTLDGENTLEKALEENRKAAREYGKSHEEVSGRPFNPDVPAVRGA